MQYEIGLSDRTLNALEKLGVNGSDAIAFMYEKFLRLPTAYIMVWSLVLVMSSIVLAIAKKLGGWNDPDGRNGNFPMLVVSVIMACALLASIIGVCVNLVWVMAPEAFAISRILRLLIPKHER